MVLCRIADQGGAGGVFIPMVWRVVNPLEFRQCDAPSRAQSERWVSRIRTRGRTPTRNVAVAMGNWFASVNQLAEEAVPALEDEEPRVREHAAWALSPGVR